MKCNATLLQLAASVPYDLNWELGDPVWGWCKTTQLAGAGLAGAAAPLRPRALNTALQDMQPSNVQNTEEKWRIAEILLLILNIEPGMKAFL